MFYPSPLEDVLIVYRIVPRTREGYYHTTGGVDCAVNRALAYAPYADLLWLELTEPNVEEARMIARKIRSKYPGKCAFSSCFVSSIFPWY